MGKLIRLKGVNFIGAPKLKQFDELETNGSLMLLDMTSMSGMPNNGASIPNLLRDYTQTITGQTSGLDFTMRTRSPDNANWKAERTGKGGLHGIIKQNTGNTTEYTVEMRGPIAVRDYILANPNHNFYVSMWSTVTRPAISNPAVQSNFHFSTDVSGGTNGLFNMAAGKFNTVGGNLINDSAVPSTYDGDTPNGTNKYNSAQYSGVVNVGQQLNSNHHISIGVGAFGPWGYFNTDKGASKIIYRVYMEDLTVSGRTFAQVNAIDKALYDIAFGVGGKFYNDTYTDPATI
jgi:hypothetical protein